MLLPSLRAEKFRTYLYEGHNSFKCTPFEMKFGMQLQKKELYNFLLVLAGRCEGHYSALCQTLKASFKGK